MAGHKGVRILLVVYASKDLLLEHCDMANAYMRGRIDVLIVVRQPTDWYRIKKGLHHHCPLQKSLFSVEQTGRVWSDVIHEEPPILDF